MTKYIIKAQLIMDCKFTYECDTEAEAERHIHLNFPEIFDTTQPGCEANRWPCLLYEIESIEAVE